MAALSAVERLRQVLQLELSNRPVDDFAERITRDILEAETAEDVFKAAEQVLAGAENYVGIPLRIVGVNFAKSAYNEPGSVGAFAIVNGVDPNGIPVVWHVGGRTAVTQLFRWDQMEAYPLIAVLVTIKSQANPGNVAYRFRPPTPEEEATFASLDGSS